MFFLYIAPKIMRLKQIALFTLLCVAMISCTGFNKLLKSNDTQAKYDEAMRLYSTKKYQKAITLFDDVSPQFMGTPYEDTITFMLGKSFYAVKDYQAAGELMDQYRNRFSRSALTEEAEYIHAMSFYRMSGSPERDQTETHRAIIAFNEYMNRYPTSPFNKEIVLLIEELQNKLYYKKYLNAVLYYKIGYYNSAVTSLRAVLRENPDITYREEMMYMICKSWYAYAKNSIYARQLDRYLKMIDAYYNFKTAYPESKQFGRELERMFEQAEKFTAINGVTAQSIETSTSKIEDLRTSIDDNKEKMYSARTVAERRVLKQSIKDARASIKAEKAVMNKDKKTIKTNEKGTN